MAPIDTSKPTASRLNYNVILAIILVAAIVTPLALHVCKDRISVTPSVRDLRRTNMLEMRNIYEDIVEYARRNNDYHLRGIRYPKSLAIKLSSLREKWPEDAVIKHLVDANIGAHFWMTIAVKRRNEEWEPVDLKDDLDIPLVFEGESFGKGGVYGYASVAYLDGRIESNQPLPLLAIRDRSVSYDHAYIVDLKVLREDSRFDWASRIEGLRIQALTLP